MRDGWLALGDLRINLDRVIGVNVSFTYQVPDGPPSQGVRGSPEQKMKAQSGVAILIDASGQVARLRNWSDVAEDAGGHLLLRYPDGSPEAISIRNYFSGNPA